jgi:hypothetical protein
MLLATSDIGMGVKSYGQCMNDFFSEFARPQLQSLADPAGVSGIIVASASNDDLNRAHNAAKEETACVATPRSLASGCEKN